MYEGRTAAEPGIMFSQENMGTIQEMGPAEKEGKVGDGVVMPDQHPGEEHKPGEVAHSHPRQAVGQPGLGET